MSEVQEETLSVGYQEFQSDEFEEDKISDTEEKDSSEVETDVVDGKKLTAEEAFGSDEDKAEDPATEETTETKEAEQPEYTPNLSYKVYDQEKEFPDQLKSLVKDKETEDYFRTLLSKADGLDEMKPRHQELVGERDQLKTQVDFFTRDVNRVLELRDKAPHVFCNEVGITDDWIIKRAKELVQAKDTPEAYDSFKRTRDLEVQSYNQQLLINQNNEVQSQSFVNNINTGVQNAMAHPEVSSFRQQFDQLHGLGAFEREVTKHGYFHYEETKRKTGTGLNLDPAEAVKQVYEFHKRAFTPPAKEVSNVSEKKPVVKEERAKPIPQVGKGRNVSPTGQRRPKTIAELRKLADSSY